jgi:hypothetical protein
MSGVGKETTVEGSQSLLDTARTTRRTRSNFLQQNLNGVEVSISNVLLNDLSESCLFAEQVGALSHP